MSADAQSGFRPCLSSQRSANGPRVPRTEAAWTFAGPSAITAWCGTGGSPSNMTIEAHGFDLRFLTFVPSTEATQKAPLHTVKPTMAAWALPSGLVVASTAYFFFPRKLESSAAFIVCFLG